MSPKAVIRSSKAVAAGPEFLFGSGRDVVLAVPAQTTSVPVRFATAFCTKYIATTDTIAVAITM